MKNLKRILACALAVIGLASTVPLRAEAAASTTVYSRTNFENQQRNNSKLFKDTMIDNALFKFPFYMLANPTDPNIYGYYGEFILKSTLGQNTVFTIPDPGASTANFLLSAGAQTIAGVQTFTASPILPAAGFVLKGNSTFNGTFSIPSLGQTSAYAFPDPGSASANVLLDQGVTSAITIQHVAVPLTAANILAMYATPIQLIAAPATGKNIVVHHAMLTMTPDATTAFTGGTNVEIQEGNAVHGAGTLTTAAIAATVVDAAAASATTYTTVIPVSYTSTSATGLFVSVTGSSFAAGGAGSAIVDLWYSIK